MEEEKIFALKDSRGNYVGSNSIYHNKVTKVYAYSYSKYLTNGFYTYQTEMSAKDGLRVLQEKELEINNGITFHIEGINRRETLIKESNKNVPKIPFVQEYYKEGLAIA